MVLEFIEIASHYISVIFKAEVAESRKDGRMD
jgi:hypothetical protein